MFSFGNCDTPVIQGSSFGSIQFKINLRHSQCSLPVHGLHAGWLPLASSPIAWQTRWRPYRRDCWGSTLHRHRDTDGHLARIHQQVQVWPGRSLHFVPLHVQLCCHGKLVTRNRYHKRFPPLPSHFFFTCWILGLLYLQSGIVGRLSSGKINVSTVPQARSLAGTTFNVGLNCSNRVDRPLRARWQTVETALKQSWKKSTSSNRVDRPLWARWQTVETTLK